MKSSIVRLKLTAIAVAAAIALLGFYSLSTRQFRAGANSAGPPPGHTGAPPEQTCVACHSSFPLNSTDGGGSIQIIGLPNRYRPLAQYPLSVTVNQTNAVVFGFQATAVNRLGFTAGTFQQPLQSPAQTQIVQGVVNVNGQNITRRYIEHTAQGLTPTQFNTKSWNFTWLAEPTRGRVTFYAAGNGANSDGGTAGDYVYSTAATVCSSLANSNFDSDNRSDIAVFRPSNGTWYRLNSTDNSFSGFQFGSNGDRIVPGDYDADGRTDFAVFRAGFWYIQQSSNNQFVGYQFGSPGDVPVPGDFTGDGRSELAVFRNGAWYTLNLVNNDFAAFNWGTTGDKPIQGDFDGDGKADYAVYRPSAGSWYVVNSSNNQIVGQQFGIAEDKPVAGDYDADGRTDFAVFRPSNGTWYFQRSTAGFGAQQFGISTDQPAPADYDGDCQTDVAVFREGNWYISNSSNGQFRAIQFGSPNDVAVPNAYTAQ
jgi:hypothetical protein